MNELTEYQRSGLPTTPTDLAKFILVAQEKVKAVKAEIRAIKKLELAKEVYTQKMEEQRRLQEVILLAYLQMGEASKAIPKSPGKRTDKEPIPANGNRSRGTKAQAIQDLGLSTSQVGRMEQMAAHPDIVEEVIAESQAGQTEATQTEVLRRIKEQGNVIDLAQKRKGRTRQRFTGFPQTDGGICNSQFLRYRSLGKTRFCPCDCETQNLHLLKH